MKKKNRILSLHFSINEIAIIGNTFLFRYKEAYEKLEEKKKSEGKYEGLCYLENDTGAIGKRTPSVPYRSRTYDRLLLRMFCH